MDNEKPMKDFFISYNHHDRKWAEWIAYKLEETGYSTVKDWDFPPGSNWALEMQKAATETRRTIAVLSQSYLNAEYTQPEWAAAFAKDPLGQNRALVPFRVDNCQPTGLLRQIVYVDLVGLSEADARSAVLGAFTNVRRPSQGPAFPGAVSPSGSHEATTGEPKPFPGAHPPESVSNSLGLTEHVRRELVKQRLSPSERFQLIQRLNSLAAEQLNMLIIALNQPPSSVLPMPASTEKRVQALLAWAEGSEGYGLPAVAAVLDQMRVGFTRLSHRDLERYDRYRRSAERNALFLGLGSVILAVFSRSPRWSAMGVPFGFAPIFGPVPLYFLALYFYMALSRALGLRSQILPRLAENKSSPASELTKAPLRFSPADEAYFATRIATCTVLLLFVLITLFCYGVLVWDFWQLDFDGSTIHKGYELLYHWSGWNGLWPSGHRGIGGGLPPVYSWQAVMYTIGILPFGALLLVSVRKICGAPWSWRMPQDLFSWLRHGPSF